MKIRVSLHGTLRQGLPDYQDPEGIEVELPDGATVHDLLIRMNIPASRGPVVVVEGRVQRVDAPIPCNTHAQIFQSMHGG